MVQENFVGTLPYSGCYLSYFPAQLTRRLPDALSPYKFCFPTPRLA
jgi:hypothetical protein